MQKAIRQAWARRIAFQVFQVWTPINYSLFTSGPKARGFTIHYSLKPVIVLRIGRAEEGREK